ncbi:unnamed protein product [Rotaria sordida]|uniref:Cullin N-terminal domain-containing protein n=1 Tax=Rotaria sordida TaxID=392033 RepID=A0A815IHJ4_9BILA|nr:unnamed protein product [Rotaria sordida]
MARLSIFKILDNHTEFFKLVRCFLNNDQHFIAALSKACGNFINNNTITKATRNTKKSAELLTLYCDALLRQGGYVCIPKNLISSNDDDVAVEQQRIYSYYDKRSRDVLRMIDLVKICGWRFERNFTAVKQGKCFDLLGIYSSGKSTIFTMLTGEISMTDDNAFVNNCSIIK